MKVVTFYVINKSGKQEEIAECLWDGKTISFHGDTNLVANLQSGIIDHKSSNGNMLIPRDGFAFLSELQYAFRSAYLRATPPMDKDI